MTLLDFFVDLKVNCNGFFVTTVYDDIFAVENAIEGKYLFVDSDIYNCSDNEDEVLEFFDDDEKVRSLLDREIFEIEPFYVESSVVKWIDNGARWSDSPRPYLVIGLFGSEEDDKLYDEKPQGYNEWSEEYPFTKKWPYCLSKDIYDKANEYLDNTGDNVNALYAISRYIVKKGFEATKNITEADIEESKKNKVSLGYGVWEYFVMQHAKEFCDILETSYNFNEFLLISPMVGPERY